MKFFEHRSILSLVVTVQIMLAVSVAASAAAAGPRDVLWDVVSNCLNPNIEDYCTNCRSPRIGTTCAAGLPCKDTTEVWAETDTYIAVRDRKMCGCPGDFVHGLALPRTRVTGVEDPHRPDGIWGFAWATAIERIDDESAVALAVNPKGKRAQDQLHVHIVRLQKNARQRFAKARTTRVQKLDEVWSTASRSAAAAGLADYGILVASNPEGGFIVLVDWASPEKSYALERCR